MNLGRLSVYGARLFGLALFIIALVALGSFLRVPGQQSQDSFAADSSSPRFLFWAFQGQGTTFFSALAEDPNQRQTVASLNHSEGYPPRAGLAPQGHRAALAVLPVGLPERGDNAGLWLLNVATGATQRLLEHGVDLRQPPIWSPDGEWVAFRRTTVLSFEERRFELLAVRADRPAEQRLLASVTSADVLAIAPLGWGLGGAFYYVSVRPQGTEIWQVRGSGASRVATISKRVALDARLSPDGRQVAFVAPKVGNATPSPSELGVLDLGSARIRTVVESGSPILGPVWSAQGEALAYGLGTIAGQSRSSGAKRLRASGEELSSLTPPPFEGFDVPLAWDSNGRYLAVRALEAKSLDNVTQQQIAIVSESGAARRQVQAPGFVDFVGWLP